MNKKPIKRAIFRLNIVFSLYFKIRVKNFTPQNNSLFRSTSCFGVTKIIISISLQKSLKCVRTLKKTAPQYNLNYFICKKTRKTNNGLSYRFAALNKIIHKMTLISNSMLVFKKNEHFCFSSSIA